MPRNSKGQFVKARAAAKSLRSRARGVARRFAPRHRKVSLMERVEKPVQYVVAPTFGALAAASPFIQMPSGWNASGPLPLAALVEHVSAGDSNAASMDLQGFKEAAVESIPNVAELALVAILTRWAGRKLHI